MNDEATSYYHDVMENMTWGHQFLLQEFGKKALPKVGWQLDNFGHTLMMPQLLSEMGMNSWFFARMDYQDKDLRIRENRLEHLQVTPRAQTIFTHATKNHYSPPPNFNFDVRNGDSLVTRENI